MADSRISPYSLNDLKNTTDDALGNYLRGLNFKQDNSKLDVRLALGYTAVIIAAATFGADYKFGWEVTKTGTAWAVAAYTLLNGALTLWLWFVEKGLIFEGARDGKKVRARVRSRRRGIFLTFIRSLSPPKRRSTTQPITSTLRLQNPVFLRAHYISRHLSPHGSRQTVSS